MIFGWCSGSETKKKDCLSFSLNCGIDRDKPGLRRIFQVRTRRNLEDGGCRTILSDDEFDPDRFIWILGLVEEHNMGWSWSFFIFRGLIGNGNCLGSMMIFGSIY